MKGNTKLQKLLNHRNLTQKWLSEKVAEQCHTPLNEAQINKICKGVAVNYHVNTLIKICRALDVTPNEILSKEDYNALFKK